MDLRDAGRRRSLLERYGSEAVPRYTSYPSANHWRDAGDAEVAAALAASGERALSLYVHVPFCRKLCFYCGCNMLVTRNTALVERYLRALELEVDRVADRLPRVPEVVQLHLGGGTPTYLDSAQLTRLVATLRRRFSWKPDVEASIEIHPPVTTAEQMRTLARLGFNRVSMGVQDFDPRVQQRINRPQPFSQTRDLIAHARKLGIRSVNVDLMYGLPAQTAEGFAHTLELVGQLRPDRLAVFGYAHMPRLKPHQKLLDGPDLPGPELRLELLELALSTLQAQGYEAIGLDHFALQGDELTRARAQGTLRRNFMGYTTCAESDLLAFGPSSISEVQGAFVANVRETKEWADCIDAGQLPVERGWEPTPDDDLRRELIQALFCQLQIDLPKWSADHGKSFEQVFARELTALKPLVDDGLVTRTESLLRITPAGQLLLRNVAAVFDAYLAQPAKRQHSTAV